MSYYDDDDDDDVLNSEVIWTFRNFKKEVIDAYPNGKCISENLVTIGGENTWKVEFYPNGKDSLTLNKITVVITLIKTNDKSLLAQTEAECNYRFLNVDRRYNYVGKVARQKFKSFVSAQDSSFESALLQRYFSNENDQNFLIAIQISQFKARGDQEKSNNENIKFNKNLRTIQVVNSDAPAPVARNASAVVDDSDLDFQKVNVKHLY